MDANFKLKQKERGFNDAQLLDGLAFTVSTGALQNHLKDCSERGLTAEVCSPVVPISRKSPDQHQISTCGSNFNAVTQAHSKYTKGYAVTGVGAVDCARHGFKRPNGVVDLQKGER